MTDENQLINGVKEMAINDMLADSNPQHATLGKKEKAMAWGRPGHLTKEELNVYVSWDGSVAP